MGSGGRLGKSPPLGDTLFFLSSLAGQEVESVFAVSAGFIPHSEVQSLVTVLCGEGLGCSG